MQTNKKLFQTFVENYSVHVPPSKRHPLPSTFYEERFQAIQTKRESIKVQVINRRPSKTEDAIKVMTIEIIAPFSVFTVDNIIDYIERQRIPIDFIVHCVFSVKRDSEGNLLGMASAIASENRENWIYLETSYIENEKTIGNDLQKVTNQLNLSVKDFESMRNHLSQLSFAQREQNDLVQWLKDNFIFVGMIIEGKQKLGIFCDESSKELAKIALQFEQKMSKNRSVSAISFFESPIKSDLDSNKYIYLVNFFTDTKKIVLAGFFAKRGELSWKKTIPTVTETLNKLYQDLNLTPFSHFARQIDKISQMLPVAFFFTKKHLFYSWFKEILSRIYSNRLEILYFPDKIYNTLWVLILIPKDDVETIPIYRLTEILDQEQISINHNFDIWINHFIIQWMNLGARKPIGEIEKIIENNKQDFLYSWQALFQKLLNDKLANKLNTYEIQRLGQKYISSLSTDYFSHQTPIETYEDLIFCENWVMNGIFQTRLYTDEKLVSKIKVYSKKTLKAMQLLPILKNYGFEIDRLVKLQITGENSTIHIYAFRLVSLDIYKDAKAERIAKAINNSLLNGMKSETIDSLVLKLDLNYREISLIKAWVAYIMQIDRSYSRSSLYELLLDQQPFTRMLLDCFHERLHPEQIYNAQIWDEKWHQWLEKLKNSLIQRMSNNFIQLVQAIVRTNYYLQKSAIGFKIDIRLMPSLENSSSLYEVFVYGSDWEGIHIRGGKISRGGIRWSDRIDDYRTEILSLMRAQISKNTIIVPTGSKGGFVLRNRSIKDYSEKEWLAMGQDTYQHYIRVLLSLTDNRNQAGDIIPASKNQIKRLDDDDSYLVVAADKGTSSFSDLANQISLEQKFWLEDAFASGGSLGYNHKDQGITARGAWFSFLRHAKEKQLDLAKHTLRVVGIGDMSGDVFGNGLLIHENLHLIGAFNHLYIFFDPNPDIKIACQERKRLFKVGGNWDHYNLQLISQGGGVFSRHESRITLNQKAREVLATDQSIVHGEELIKLILRAPVDLVWNGGVGTYVKSAKETHYQAQDLVNDRVRINANELRTKILVEGGNLGLTPIARVEASKNNVALNTDFIDNSGGVNMSDHEVNLKILLSLLTNKNLIKREQRNQIIKDLAMEQEKLVLQYNEKINLAISLDQQRTKRDFIYFRSLIKFLNQRGYFTRGENAIPFESELDEIQEKDQKLHRPILCTLLCYAKGHIDQTIRDSHFFDGENYNQYLYSYFPSHLTDVYQKEIVHHPLKKEIIITIIVNEIVHSAGMTYFQKMKMRINKPDDQIAHTYLILSNFLDLPNLRKKPKWREHSAYLQIYYDFLLLIEEQIFFINRMALENEMFLNIYQPEYLERFKVIHRQCIQYCSYQFNEDHYDFPLENEDDLREILEDFKAVEVLEDACQILSLQSLLKIDIKIADYYMVSRKFHLHKLQKLISSLPTSNEWEILFLARLEKLRRDFIFSYLKKYASTQNEISIKSQVLPLENRIISATEHLVSKQHTSFISAPMLYETFSFLIRLIEESNHVSPRDSAQLSGKDVKLSDRQT